MPDWWPSGFFLATAAILVLIPGPNTLFIVARSVERGRAAGIISSLGVQTGTLFHTAAAALGLSALILSSAAAFNTLRYAGAVYLIYLGVKTLLGKGSTGPEPSLKQSSLRRLYLQGALVNILNPKTAFFFFAFLPQFVGPARGPVAAQIISLGLILVALGALSDLVYALAAGSIAGRLRDNPKLLRGQKYFAGSVYIGLGALAAFGGTYGNKLK